MLGGLVLPLNPSKNHQGLHNIKQEIRKTNNRKTLRINPPLEAFGFRHGDLTGGIERRDDELEIVIRVLTDNRGKEDERGR